MKLSEIASVVEQYGGALRGDWSSIDGRAEQAALQSVSAAINNPEEWTVAELRCDLDVCPTGRQHWTEWCGEGCSASTPESAA